MQQQVELNLTGVEFGCGTTVVPNCFSHLNRKMPYPEVVRNAKMDANAANRTRNVKCMHQFALMAFAAAQQQPFLLPDCMHAVNEVRK